MNIIVYGGIFAIAIGVFLVLATFAGYAEPIPETETGYECGFIAFEEARIPIELSFYLLSLIFLLFDLEVVLLIPWIIVVSWTGIAVYIVGWFFITILAVGFVYELKTQRLEWII